MKHELPKLNTRAALRPASMNIEARTAEFVLSAGTKGRRYSWDEDYFEELAIDKNNIRLERLDNGIPFLKDHDSRSIDNVLGKVIDYRFEDGLLIGVVQFSSDEESIRYFEKVKEGILGKVSVGYRVHKYEDVSEDDDKLKTYRAIDWEIFEASLVAIPFDDKSQVRNEKIDTNKVEIIKKRQENSQMKVDKEKELEKTPTIDVKAIEEKARNAAVELERTRINDITVLCRTHKMDDDFTTEMVGKGKTISEARELILPILAKKN